MNKLTLPLSLLAAATLAACAGAQQTQVLGTVDSTYVASAGTVQNTGPSVRTGKGKVAYLVDKDGPVNGVSTQRVTMHMNDGTTQVIETRGAQLAMGEHIRISQDSNVGRDKYYFHASE